MIVPGNNRKAGHIQSDGRALRSVLREDLLFRLESILFSHKMKINDLEKYGVTNMLIITIRNE